MQLSINRLSTSDADFSSQLDLISQSTADNEIVAQSVRSIIKSIRKEGDSALLKYTNYFDGLNVKSVSELVINKEQMQLAAKDVADETLSILRSAATRINHYAKKQKLDSWDFLDKEGNRIGQSVTPLDTVGLYIPGGKAIYPSSLLMTAIPAKVAGVPFITAAIPSFQGEINPLLLATADLCGVDIIYSISGAQAIAAMAFGTETIKRVDKIAGPGNQYVTEAKRQVFGFVGIDSLAGPSEILIVCDATANPEWIAADLFSQAEHDEQARAILICLDEDFINDIVIAMESLIKKMPRANIIKASFANRSCLIHANNLDEAADIVNCIAPEHLEIVLADETTFVPKVRNAGAIFIGAYSPEVIGDYCAGPSHVLPTAGAARFSSLLGVYDFQKRSSIIQCSAQGVNHLSKMAVHLAHCEGLLAHVQSAEYRISDKKNE